MDCYLPQQTLNYQKVIKTIAKLGLILLELSYGIICSEFTGWKFVCKLDSCMPQSYLYVVYFNFIKCSKKIKDSIIHPYIHSSPIHLPTLPRIYAPFHYILMISSVLSSVINLSISVINPSIMNAASHPFKQLIKEPFRYPSTSNLTSK